MSLLPLRDFKMIPLIRGSFLSRNFNSPIALFVLKTFVEKITTERMSHRQKHELLHRHSWALNGDTENKHAKNVLGQ